MRRRRDFPGGPVVKTSHSHCRGHGFEGSIPGWGTKILHATQHSQEKKKKNRWRGGNLGRNNEDTFLRIKEKKADQPQAKRAEYAKPES